MAKPIPSGKGRIYLMLIVAICFVGAMVSLFFTARGGAINSDNLLNAVIKFLGFYIPLLSLIGTFLFKGEKDEGDSQTSMAAFLFAVFISLIWVLTPILLLVSGLNIEDVLSYIDKLIPVGQSLALMAIGYYFSKDKDKPAAQPPGK